MSSTFAKRTRFKFLCTDKVLSSRSSLAFSLDSSGRFFPRMLFGAGETSSLLAAFLVVLRIGKGEAGWNVIDWLLISLLRSWKTHMRLKRLTGVTIMLWSCSMGVVSLDFVPVLAEDFEHEN